MKKLFMKCWFRSSRSVGLSVRLSRQSVSSFFFDNFAPVPHETLSMTPFSLSPYSTSSYRNESQRHHRQFSVWSSSNRDDSTTTIKGFGI